MTGRARERERITNKAGEREGMKKNRAGEREKRMEE